MSEAKGPSFNYEGCVLIYGSHRMTYEMLEKFLAHCPVNMGKLRAAYTEQDYENLAIFAHSVKGMALYIAAKGLENASLEVKHAVEGQQVDRLPELIASLEAEVARVTTDVQNQLAQAQQPDVLEPE